MKIVRTSEMPWGEAMTRGGFANQRKPLGGERFSAGLWQLPPGKKSFPLHTHHVTDEGLFVVSGRAHVRTPEGETEIGPGDFVHFPPGGPAHQLINRGTEPLVYLAISASIGADVVEYPDSGKVACAVGTFPKGTRYMFGKEDQKDYFHGEKDAES